MLRSLKMLLRRRDGSMLVEMALAIPVLTALVMAGVDFSRFMVLNQRLERASGIVGDVVSRPGVLSPADFGGFFAAAQQVTAPFNMAADGAVIISAVLGDTTNGPSVLWQRAGAGAAMAASVIGNEGGAATLPAGLSVGDGESIVVTEVYYDFAPLFLGPLLPAKRLYHRSIHRPRTTNVLTISGGAL